MSEQNVSVWQKTPTWKKIAFVLYIVVIVVILIIILAMLFYTGSWEAFPIKTPGNYYVKRSYSPSWVNQPTGNANGSYLNYQGCYVDKMSRSFKNKAPKNMNLDDCYEYALSKGDNYMGLQYWKNNLADLSKSIGECFTGSTLPTYGLSKDCELSPSILTATLDSTGPHPYQVGGPWTNAVYQLQTPS